MFKRTQQLPTLLAKNVGSCCVCLHVAKSLPRVKLWPTNPNNMQQGVQMDATCNTQQCWELLANNVASVCTGLKNYRSQQSIKIKLAQELSLVKI